MLFDPAFRSELERLHKSVFSRYANDLRLKMSIASIALFKPDYVYFISSKLSF